MIKILIKGKEQLLSNKRGMEILQKSNPKDKFRIAICDYTKKSVVQYYDFYTPGLGKQWVCLHD